MQKGSGASYQTGFSRYVIRHAANQGESSNLLRAVARYGRYVVLQANPCGTSDSSVSVPDPTFVQRANCQNMCDYKTGECVVNNTERAICRDPNQFATPNPYTVLNWPYGQRYSNGDPAPIAACWDRGRTPNLRTQP